MTSKGQADAGIFICGLILAVSQIQAGWLQHDFGHQAVFSSNRMNTIAHSVVIGALKGASSAWWKSRHNRHHSLTNVVHKDPDIHTDPLFVWDGEMTKEPIAKKNKFLAYQNRYWWIFGPPSVTTVLFIYQNIMFIFRFQQWRDFCWVLAFFLRFAFSYSLILSGWQCLLLYFWMRFVESHWFTWVTSMNHLPRQITYEQNHNWVQLHTVATQNVTAGPFHNWFTGHLNHQIEHHLFPNMPRHHLPEVSSKVKALCVKHGYQYHVKTMNQACRDILSKLTAVGKVWQARNEL